MTPFALTAARIIAKKPQPKPCPKCYAPMNQTAAGWECSKHGPPSKP